MLPAAVALALAWVAVLPGSTWQPPAPVPPGAGASGQPFDGRVRFVKVANSGFDAFTRDPAPPLRAWMRRSYDRLIAYAPYFDSRTSWFPRALAYQDAYAVYASELDSVRVRHPEWLLRDARGRPLFIPYGCRGGSCPQYAGDFTDPSFQSDWIARASRKLAAGYVGLLVDDVNLDPRVSDGSGRFVRPVDSRTGLPMTDEAWRRAMAEFMERVRRELGDAEIVHNVLWYAGGILGVHDLYVRRELAAADQVMVERGVADAGLTPGSGVFGFATFLSFVADVHDLGRSVLMQARSSSRAQAEYGLAGHLLTAAAGDRYGDTYRSTPVDWWDEGYGVSLGTASGPAYTWQGVLRRDFRDGVVLLHGPGGGPVTVTLDQPCSTLEGHAVRRLTLGERSGAVLLSASAPVLRTPRGAPPSARSRAGS